MAKKSRKRLGREHSGCMWSLINIFDFRQVHSSQKLLPDRKRVSKLVGASYPDVKFESLGDTCEICKEINEPVQSGASTIDSSKMSVKELMEDEMCGEHDQKRHGSIAKGDVEQTIAGEGQGMKCQRRTRSKASLELDAHPFSAAKDLVTERPSHRKHKSASSVDLNVMVEELCGRIHQNDASCLKHSQGGEVASQPIEDPSVSEENLWEATKVLVNHFAEGKTFPNDLKSQPVTELVDALRILDSHKEVFLKLLQDPGSLLVKHLQSLQDIQVEEGKFKVLTDSSLLEEDIGNVKQQSFWRRFKGPERNSSKKTDTSDVSNRIVVLKPGPPGSRSLDMASTCGSLPESLQSMRDCHQTERVASIFSFSEFKRKLKHAMRKEQHGVVQNGMSYQPSHEQPKLLNHDKKVGENAGMASPSRDHFFIERIPKFSVGVKKVDKIRKPKDGKMNLEHDSTLSPERRVSNIYAEAKKHLAEIVVNSDEDGDTLGRQVPKSLGRILSYSGYSSPTICSPRIERETRWASDGGSWVDDKTCQVTPKINVSLPDQVNQEPENEPCIAAGQPPKNNDSLPDQVNQELENEPCIAAGQLSPETDIPALEPTVSHGFSCEIAVDKHIHELGLPTSEDIFISPDAESQKESKLIGFLLEPCSLQPIKTCEQVGSSSTTKSSENWPSENLKQDTHAKDEPSSSPSISAHVCSITERNKSVDATSDASSRPSPISVLEPLFKDDDITSPAVELTAAEPIRPRQIHFEEEILAPSEQVPCNRTCAQGEKYTFEFVKAVVQMSGLTWDELLRRSFVSDHLVDPSLLDEVDFLPDLLSCDFNLLFDLINEVLIEICLLNFSCFLSFAKPFVQPELKGKDIFTEIWKGVDWQLKLEGPPRTLDQIVAKDLTKARAWMYLQPDCESVGVRVQQAILEELVEDSILSCVTRSLDRELPVLRPAEAVDSEISVEL